MHVDTGQSAATDQQLVESLRQGSREALEQIYTRYRDRLCNYAYRLVGDRDRVDDVVHETFIKVWSNIGRLNDTSSFRSWLFAIARNEALLQLRDRKPFEELNDETTPESDDPLSALISNELSGSVTGLLDALRPSYKELIVLKVYEALTYAEIASVTGLSLSAVRVHLYRARKALAALYDKHCGDKHVG